MNLKITKSINASVIESIRVNIASNEIAALLQDVYTFVDIYDAMYEQLSFIITDYDIRANALNINLYIDNCLIADNR